MYFLFIWFLSLSIFILKFMHIVPLSGYTIDYSPVDEHQYLTTTNKTVINIHIYVFLWAYTFISLRHVLSYHHNT